MAPSEWSRQPTAEVRFDWGPTSIEALSDPDGIHVVIVDVLRFTTAVDVAVSRGGRVVPGRWVPTGDTSWLSPERLSRDGPVKSDGAIGLRSPNGSHCATLALGYGATVVAACLRNAAAVSAWLNERTHAVSVIACGERWPDGTLRPALEDYLGAGAVISGLVGRRSPEAELAARAWLSGYDRVADLVRDSVSGRELEARGHQADIDFACALDASSAVPVIRDGAFTDASAFGSGDAPDQQTV